MEREWKIGEIKHQRDGGNERKREMAEKLEMAEMKERGGWWRWVYRKKGEMVKIGRLWR